MVAIASATALAWVTIQVSKPSSKAELTVAATAMAVSATSAVASFAIASESARK